VPHPQGGGRRKAFRRTESGYIRKETAREVKAAIKLAVKIASIRPPDSDFSGVRANYKRLANLVRLVACSLVVKWLK
jgi:hypothetical protein